MQASEQTRRRGGGLAYKWIVAIVVIIGVFMSILDQTIVNIAIPHLQAAFGADLHTVQWVLTAYILTQGVVTPTAAFFADTLGIKRFYIISLAAFTLGSALCGLSWSLPALIFFRILQGIGGASLFPLSMALAFREFPPEERGMSMGLFGVPALLAPAIGPTLGGYLVTYAGWQLIFYINVPVGIVAVLLAIFLLREQPVERRPRFDAAGFVFAAAGLASLLYALSEASTYGWGSTLVRGFLLAGVLALAIFTAIELMLAARGGEPLLDLRIFTNGPFTTSTIAQVFIIFGMFGGLFLFPIYLQDLRGLSAFQAGLLLLPQALASMVSSVLGGVLVDRLGVRPVMIPGLLALALANWELTTITVHSPFGWFQWILVLRGVALGLSVQPLAVASLSTIRPEKLAQASSISTVTRSVSSSLGIAVLATLVQTQNQIHFGHLAEMVTPSSPLGQLIPRIQALFILHGADARSAYNAALQLIAQLLQQRSYVLAMQDAFRVTLLATVLAMVATLFVRSGVRPRWARRRGAPAASEERTTAAMETMFAG
ncbi:MDR family MFS transporter [Thermogemmatispora onikobensis]|uniref:MDR family MFS transporter n=1 Tax=Thermogemmatispora onikobensis TaxID=732234 RepID=UPI00085392F2|nr:MDR family MFS transporter [Thermogemmatispora onikobensis]